MPASNNRKRPSFTKKVERLSDNVEALTGLVTALGQFLGAAGISLWKAWRIILILLAPVALFVPGLLPTVEPVVTFLGRILTM